jgi:SNF2 family DNA or RNA helicase
MQFVLPDFLGNYTEFKEKYVNPIKRSFEETNKLNSIIDVSNNNNNNNNNNSLVKFHSAINITSNGINLLGKLHKQVLPFILRRTKDVVAKELPKKSIINIYCPLSSIQRQLYSEFQIGKKNNLLSLSYIYSFPL